jgi:hypothetical protein
MDEAFDRQSRRGGSQIDMRPMFIGVGFGCPRHFCGLMVRAKAPPRQSAHLAQASPEQVPNVGIQFFEKQPHAQ